MLNWITQHIFELIARFRSDVYLEALTTTADTSVLVIDSNNKVCKNSTIRCDRVYGNTIKILPCDFMVNDDVAEKPLHFKDGATSGVQLSDAASEMIAFVAIPEGKKATHVDVYANGNRVLKVYEIEVDDTFDFTGTTKGTGACNTQLDITDVNSTATNFLAVLVVATATSQRTYGGLVTIADI